MINTLTINKYIVADPEICHGKPTFKGTRVMVWQILEMLAAGETVQDILEDFPSIDREHIAACCYCYRKILALALGSQNFVDKPFIVALNSINCKKAKNK